MWQDPDEVSGQCNIDITCGKCNKEIVVLVDEERVIWSYIQISREVMTWLR